MYLGLVTEVQGLGRRSRAIAGFRAEGLLWRQKKLATRTSTEVCRMLRIMQGSTDMDFGFRV